MLPKHRIRLFKSFYIYFQSAMRGSVRFSERSIFRKVDIPKSRYSERSLFRKVNIPKGRYSEKSIFRKVVIPKGRYSKKSIFRKVVIPKGRYSEKSIFRKVQNRLTPLTIKFWRHLWFEFPDSIITAKTLKRFHHFTYLTVFVLIFARFFFEHHRFDDIISPGKIHFDQSDSIYLTFEIRTKTKEMVSVPFLFDIRTFQVIKMIGLVGQDLF